MSEKKLEPCPFCGGGDSEKSNFGFGYHETRDGCWVLCMSCHAEGPLVEPSDNAKAIAAWNRRSPAPAEDGEGLREALEAWQAFDNEPRSFHSHRDLEILARARDLTKAALSPDREREKS